VIDASRPTNFADSFDGHADVIGVIGGNRWTDIDDRFPDMSMAL
jgi:hypothetical protein